VNTEILPSRLRFTASGSAAARSSQISSFAAALGLLCLWVVATARGDNGEFKTYGPIAVPSSGTGQLSSNIYSIDASTSGELQVDYLAPRTHCAKLMMHFLLDGREKAVSDVVAPGGRTGFVDLGRVPPGNHVIGLQAEGIKGGCDAGTLVSWGGSAVVWTSPLAGPAPETQRGQLGDLLFEVGYINYAQGYVNRGHVIAGDGSLYSYEYNRSDAPWNPKPGPTGLFAELDLLEKYSHNRKLVGQVPSAGFTAKQRMAWMVGEEKLAESPPPRNVAIDAGQTSYVVYRRNPSNGGYERVLLGEFGDFLWVNTAESAEKLRLWLDQVLKAAVSGPLPEVAPKPN
jgi:hypothetical protein